MPKVGRPKGSKSVKIDYALVERLANIFCTHQEISSILEISLSTLEHDEQFIAVHKKGIETAKMSLRRKQWKLADKYPNMAIFLGKNYLQQRDTWDIDLPNLEDKLDAFINAVKKSDTETD